MRVDPSEGGAMVPEGALTGKCDPEWVIFSRHFVVTMSGECSIHQSGGKMARRTNRTEKLDLRLSHTAKQTLRAAAIAERKSVSKFVLDTALSEAEERLADRRVFTLDGKRWDAFIAALDAPPRRHPRLERLFQEPSAFDRKSKS
jgi:uncharacterized protein (DUF1778 family)